MSVDVGDKPVSRPGGTLHETSSSNACYSFLTLARCWVERHGGQLRRRCPDRYFEILAEQTKQNGCLNSCHPDTDPVLTTLQPWSYRSLPRHILVCLTERKSDDLLCCSASEFDKW